MPNFIFFFRILLFTGVLFSCSEEQSSFTLEVVDGVRHVTNITPKWENDLPVTLEFVQHIGDLDAEDENYAFFIPEDITLDHSGNIYVLDTGNYRIQKFDREGRLLLIWGRKGPKAGQFSWPTEIWAANDRLFVADSRNNRLQVFDARGALVGQIGSYGSGPGQFADPVGITVTAAGILYVVDRGNGRIQKLNRDGSVLAEWGSNGTGPGQFNFPRDIVVDAIGRVYVTDTGRPNRTVSVEPTDWQVAGPNSNHRIQVFDSDGRFLNQWGSLGYQNGQFRYPYSIALTTDGHLYVADTLNHRIQKFKISGLGGPASSQSGN